MAVPGSLLKWDVPPQNGSDWYFSREIYEKYSLAPTLSELLLLSKRHAANSANVPNSGQDDKTSSEQVPGNVAKGAAKSSAGAAPFQEPRIPYPYFSSLSESEQRRYLFLLSKYVNADPSRIEGSQQKDYAQYLQIKEFVSKEVAEFLKFAQNVARSCSRDYEGISEEASVYTKKFLSSRTDFVKKYPECYTLHEVTSIMGGKFSPRLMLKSEKTLVALGKVNLIKRHFPKLPAPIQLPDHQSKNELDFATPEQRAFALHNDISTDQNAEKLAVKYCPQVVLTSESLFTLLNNHGTDYREEWELPLTVKIVSDTGLKPVRVVYIDPPLPKKEMTVREKNQNFHEFLTEFHMTKQSSVFAHAVVLDMPSENPVKTPLETVQGRQLQVIDSADLDFDTDFTELETFGSATETLRVSQLEKASGTPARTSKVLSERLKMEKEMPGDIKSDWREGTSKANREKVESISRQNFNKPPPPSGENPSIKSFKAMETEADGEKVVSAGERKTDNKTFFSSSKNFKERTEEVQENRLEVLSRCSDSEEESLIIDTEYKNDECLKSSVSDSNQGLEAQIPNSSCPGESLAEEAENPSQHREMKDLQKAQGEHEPAHETSTPQKPSRRLSKKCDPVGQILQMQTELLKPLPPPCGQGQPEKIPERRSSSPTPNQSYSLSKAFALPSLEPAQKTTSESSASSRFSWAAHFQGSQKGLLWDGSEDRSEYEVPPRGNLIYKLFSLDDLLLLVRSSVQKVELLPRNKKAKIRRHYPVFILPKLEYQAFYGAELLTEGEICRLWMESLLHSNSSFAVGHIDALTSKLFLLEELSAEDLKTRFGTFKPANSLNILRHILKKVTSLQEGSYLLAHVAGDSSLTIYKSSDRKTTRPAYNLHAAHSDLPRAPSTLGVPWVPLDPNLPLPYHFAQGWVPCTFPPKPADTQKKQKKSGTKARPGTPNHREPIAMETNNICQPTHPFRKRQHRTRRGRDRSTGKPVKAQAPNSGKNPKMSND